MKIRGGNQDRPSSSAPNLIMLNSMEQTRCVGVGVANSKRETRGVDHVLSEGRRPRPGGPACREAAPPSAAPHRAGTQQAAGLFSCLTLPWEAKRVSLWRGGNSLLGKTAHACRISAASPAGPSSTTRVMHVALHLLVTLTRTHSPNRGSMSDQTHSVRAGTTAGIEVSAKALEVLTQTWIQTAGKGGRTGGKKRGASGRHPRSTEVLCSAPLLLP